MPSRSLIASVGLQRAHDPGQHAEHAALGARRRELGRRRLREEAAVARALVRLEDRELALEAEDRGVHDGHAGGAGSRRSAGSASGSCRCRRRRRRSPRGSGRRSRRSSRSRYSTTFTSGFSARSVLPPTRSSASPMRSVVCRIWRCRFVSSTTSASTMPSVPTPAAARYSAAGEPRPPAPISSTFEAEQLELAGLADLGDQDVPAVAAALVGVEHGGISQRSRSASSPRSRRAARRRRS